MDNAENRKLGRVGKQYGGKKEETKPAKTTNVKRAENFLNKYNGKTIVSDGNISFKVTNGKLVGSYNRKEKNVSDRWDNLRKQLYDKHGIVLTWPTRQLVDGKEVNSFTYTWQPNDKEVAVEFDAKGFKIKGRSQPKEEKPKKKKEVPFKDQSNHAKKIAKEAIDNLIDQYKDEDPDDPYGYDVNEVEESDYAKLADSLNKVCKEYHKKTGINLSLKNDDNALYLLDPGETKEPDAFRVEDKDGDKVDLDSLWEPENVIEGIVQKMHHGHRVR